MALGRNGYIQPVEIFAAGVGPARNGWVQPVEIVGGGGGGGAVGDIVDETGSTTDSYVEVDGFPISRSDGLIGIGSILNTGASGMNVRETATDKFGNTQSVVTVVAAGDSYLLDLQTNFDDLAFPPYTDYTVEVQSEDTGVPTDYELHYIDITPSAGGGGGSETLDEARQNGDFFLDQVYWQSTAAAMFGFMPGETDKDYLQIYSGKVDNIQVINSSHIGVGATTRPISIQFDAAETMRLTPDGALLIGVTAPVASEKLSVSGNVYVAGAVTITGKLTVTGAIDPTSLSLSGNGEGANVLYIDSANGVSAGVSAAGHGRLRYNNTSHTWQQSVNGGAYSDIGGGSSGPWTLASDFIRPTDLSDHVQVGLYADTQSAVWSATSYPLMATGESAAGGGTIIAVQHAFDDATSQCEFTGYRTRGTVAAPTALQSGDHIVRYGAVGMGDNVLRFAAAIDFYASGTFTDASAPCDIVFLTGGPSPTERIRITNAGYLTASTVVSTVPMLTTTNLYAGIGYGQNDATERALFFISQSGAAPIGMYCLATTTGYVDFYIPTTVGTPILHLAFDRVAIDKTLRMKGVTGGTSGAAIVIANNATISSKTTDGTAIDLIGLFNDDHLYVSDGNVPHLDLFCNDIIIGIGGSTDVRILGDRFGMFSHTVSAQPAAIPDASGGVVIDAEARTALNALLAGCRSLGIIAT